MVLSGLFDKPGLYNEDGTLKERWQQDGSNIVNVFAAEEDATLYTVTAGKKLYVKAIGYSCADSNKQMRIYDNAAEVFRADPITGGARLAVFDIPLVFETSIVSDNNDVFAMTFTGWEE